MLELSTALIELPIVRTPKERGVEMERKGDLVCHRALKKRKMKNNWIKNKKKKSTLTTSVTSSTHMCRVLTLKLKELEPIPGTDSSLKDQYLHKKEEDEKELMLSGKNSDNLNNRGLSHGS